MPIQKRPVLHYLQQNRSHFCSLSIFLYLLFGYPKANFGPLIMRQPHSLNIIVTTLILHTSSKGHWEPHHKRVYGSQGRAVVSAGFNCVPSNS